MSIATTPGPMRVGADHRAYRLSAIDMVRGLVVVIMAIDHVRDAVLAGTTQDPLEDPNVGIALFFTRWVTHFCAPVFVLLAGTSAGLMLSRRRPAEVSRLLFTRGVWLIVVEWTLVTFASSFSFSIPEFGGVYVVVMQVIWAIGASMIALSGLVFLGRPVCLFIGLVIVSGHNLLDPYWPPAQLLEEKWPIWVALHAQMLFRAGPVLFAFIYPLLPWIGVMLAGFGIAGVFERPPKARDAALRRAGLLITAAFVVIRAAGIYGDPNAWVWQDSFVRTSIDFINTTKYPPSLLFLLMTVGPAAILCSYADRFSGSVKETLVIFGRVPFAFYIAHFYLIHTIAIVIGVAQGFAARDFLTLFFFFPPGYGLNLAGVYIVWAVVIAILYPWCRWVASLKARRRDWWLSYV